MSKNEQQKIRNIFQRRKLGMLTFNPDGSLVAQSSDPALLKNLQAIFPDALLLANDTFDTGGGEELEHFYWVHLKPGKVVVE